MQVPPENPRSITLKNLQCLSLFRLSRLVDIRGLGHCYALERLPDLSKLRNLQSLHLEDCPELGPIEGLNSLDSLKDLVIKRCGIFVKPG